MTKSLIAILMILSASGCASAPKRPVGAIGRFNAKSNYVRTYDFKHFDKDLNYNAEPVNLSMKCEDLHGFWVLSPASKEELQAYGLKWKARLEEKK